MDTDEDVTTIDEEEGSISSSGSSQCSTTLFIAPITGSENKMQGKKIHQTKEEIHDSTDDIIEFRIMCAHTEETESEKYVVYTINVEGAKDDRPALLIRRYSDFLLLFTTLNHSHPALMRNMKFPRKVFVGNFKNDLIEERSKFFEQFLYFVYSKDVLRCSEPFRTFLFGKESQTSSHHLLHSEFEDAIPILENLYWLLRKLHGEKDQLLRVLLQLIVCLHAVRNYESACDYALMAIPRFDGRKIEGNFLAKELYVPFLFFCRRLWWILGRNWDIHEEKIASAREEGYKVDGLAELLDCLRDDINLATFHS